MEKIIIKEENNENTKDTNENHLNDEEDNETDKNKILLKKKIQVKNLVSL